MCESVAMEMLTLEWRKSDDCMIQSTLVTGHCHRPLVKTLVNSPLVSQESSRFMTILRRNSICIKCQLLRCKGSVSQSKAMIHLNFSWHYPRNHSIDVEQR